MNPILSWLALILFALSVWFLKRSKPSASTWTIFVASGLTLMGIMGVVRGYLVQRSGSTAFIEGTGGRIGSGVLLSFGLYSFYLIVSQKEPSKEESRTNRRSQRRQSRRG